VSAPLVVYLDQNKWVTLAQMRHAPTKVPESELAHAKKLVAIVERGEACLPLSMAHFLEIEHITNSERRSRLAEVMLDLSDGWYMLHPNEVQIREWRSVLDATPELTRGEMFNQTLWTLAGRAPTGEDQMFGEFPEPLRSTLSRSVERLTVRDMLHGFTRPNAEAARADAALAAWANDQNQVRNIGAAERLPKTKWPAVAALRTFREIREPLMESGTDPVTILTFMQEVIDTRGDRLLNTIRNLPYTGRLSEVSAARWVNGADQWTTNDLIDLLYLTCAAGYADVVICERKMRHMLTVSTGRVPDGAATVISFAELADVAERA
jgi:hypothetical protein